MLDAEESQTLRADTVPALSEACPVCADSSSRVAVPELVDWEYAVKPERRFRFLACTSCGSEWLDPRPTPEELLRFYPASYHAYNEDNHGWLAGLLVRLRARARARQYAAILPAQGGRLFDVGAGDCRHFRELGSRTGCTFSGIELNPEMAARGRALGYDIECGMLEDMDLGRHLGAYDAVSMNHVLEHVVDPEEVVGRARLLLKPGGWLIGQLPTVSSWERSLFGAVWAGYHFPRHLQVFSRRGLARLLERSGFTGVSLRSAPHAQAALSVQNWLLSCGLRSRLEFGRARYFSALLLLSLPFEAAAKALDRSGVIDFEARRPAGDGP